MYQPMKIKINQKIMSKTIFITGASSGIGKTTAIYFAERGWNVAATMRKPKEETELVKYKTIKCDALAILKEESISDAFQLALKYFGNIDVLVNNAVFAVLGPFEAADKAQIEKQFDTNVIGLMSVCKAFLPILERKKKVQSSILHP
jgi:NADP-dependent 3-hydroxy acid dehydrogenase YdfG